MDPDDILSTTETSATLDLFAPVSGLIETPDDSDWFKVSLIAGVTYRLTLQSRPDVLDQVLQPVFTGLYTRDNTRLLSPSTPDAWDLTVNESGDYFIAVGSESGTTGAYELSMSPQKIQDYTAFDWSLGDIWDRSFESADGTDVYRIHLRANQSYTLDLSSTQVAGLQFSSLLDSGLNRVQEPNANDPTVLTFSPAVEGDYYVLVRSTGTQTGAYTLQAQPDMALQAIDLQEGEADGVIRTTNPIDLYRIDLEAGVTYQVDMAARGASDLALGDALIYGIYDPHGMLLANSRDDDGGEGYNARVIFTPETSGFYYIEAGAFKSHTGNYQLQVKPYSEANSDDFADVGAAEAQVVALTMGTAKHGQIETAGDQDVFKVTLRAGYDYQMDIEGVATGAGNLYDPGLSGVYNVTTEGDESQWNAIPGLVDDDNGFGLNARLNYSAFEDATVYLAIGAGSSNATGNYTVTVTESSDDRSNNKNVSGASLSVNGVPLTGSLERPGDEDWFRLAISESGRYRIEVMNASPASGENLDVWVNDPILLGVYDAAGAPLAGVWDDDSGYGLNARYEVDLAQAETYFVSAGAWGEQTGQYAVLVSEVLTDDYKDNTQTAGQLNLDSSAEGVIEQEEDVDWFKIALEAGEYYQLSVESTDANPIRPLLPEVVGIYNASGLIYTQSLAFQAEKTANYFVAVAGQGDATGSYRVSLDPKDLSADIYTVGRVSADGAVVEGRIDTPNDTDWLQITLQANTRYQIRLDGNGSLKDPVIQGLYSSTGAKLDYSFDDDNGVGLDARLDYTPMLSGDYFIAVGSSDSGIGNYQLAVTTNPTDYDDLPADISTEADIKVGGYSLGRLEKSGDIDWFKTSLTAGKTYLIGMESFDPESGTLGDAYIAGVYDANRKLQVNTQNDDGGKATDALLEFMPSTSGTYYVNAQARINYNNPSANVGIYTMRVTEAAQDDYDDFIGGKVGSLSLGSSVNGHIENIGDRDWFKVSLKADTPYTISLKGSEQEDTLSNPYLYGIYDSDGGFILGTKNDNYELNTKNAQVDYTPDQDGIYYISAGAFDILTGSYILSIL